MKLKINNACDLNSISVLPPHTRRSSLIPAQQPRSQPSQQSFSQGISSQQNAMFSQISQNSFDEVLTENQRFGSQEKDNSLKRVSCLAPMSYPRDESQMPISRSSANLTRRWNSASVPDQKCQLSEELEHKLSTMETLLSRLGMILDSVQADVMQVNKGTKELSLSVEGIRQKLIAQDDSLHLMNRGQEDIKTTLDASLRSISNHLSNNSQTEKMQEILTALMNLPDQIQATVHKQSDEFSKLLSGELQTIIWSLKTLNQKQLPHAVLRPKVTGGADSSSLKLLSRSEPEPIKISKQANLAPKIEMGGWTTVKPEPTMFSNQYGRSCKNLKQRRFFPLPAPGSGRDNGCLLARHQKVVSLDDESDEDFSCFIVENGSVAGNDLTDEVDEETERILRRARRRKRKQSCKR